MKTPDFLHPPGFWTALLVVLLLIVAGALQHRPFAPASARWNEAEALLLARQRALIAAHSTATLIVFPVRIDGRVDSESACAIANRLAATRMMALCGVAPPLLLATAAEHRAEQGSVLAHNFSTHLAAHPSDADYALYAEYVLPLTAAQKGSVEFALCDAQGNLVLADRFDACSGDSALPRPATKQDCTNRLIERLGDRLGLAIQRTPTAGDEKRTTGPLASTP